jgi:hypothetical protein
MKQGMGKVEVHKQGLYKSCYTDSEIAMVRAIEHSNLQEVKNF